MKKKTKSVKVNPSPIVTAPPTQPVIENERAPEVPNDFTEPEISEEEGFLKTIAEKDDDISRLVFADWLEEDGQEDYADMIRLEVKIKELEFRRKEITVSVGYEQYAAWRKSIFPKEYQYYISGMTMNVWSGVLQQGTVSGYGQYPIRSG